MSRRDGACWRHPAQRASAGVCPDCLKERLSALSPSPPFGFVSAEPKKFASSSKNTVDASAYLRRSKSWSHWEGAGINARNQHQTGFAARKSDAVLDDWTRQRFFSIFAKDQKRNEQLQNGYPWNQHITGSRILENGSVEQGTSTQQGVNTGLVQRVIEEAPVTKKHWWSSLLQFAFGKRKKKVRPPPRHPGTSYRAPLNSHRLPKAPQKPDSSWISSPLRMLRSKRANEAHEGVYEEKRSSWSIPSHTELKRLHTSTQAYTTAYYRDYGAWSLSSSPLPSRNRGKQQWENREVHHSSSSPYKGVGTSSWNFYLSPLRPTKTSTKHRY